MSVSINDSQNQVATNSSQTFTLAATTAFIVAPTLIPFPEVIPGQTNVLGLQNLTINNTGNENITLVNITAFDLLGQVNPSYFIPAQNYTVNQTGNICAGTQLQNNTAVTIPSVTIPKQQYVNLSFCLVEVPSPLFSQNYTSLAQWIVKVLA